MRVRYKGRKELMPVTFPVGEKRKSAIKEIKFADPYIDLTDDEARLLVELDPVNFEIVKPRRKKVKKDGNNLD